MTRSSSTTKMRALVMNPDVRKDAEMGTAWRSIAQRLSCDFADHRETGRAGTIRSAFARPRSSGDRATASGAVGRRFESCRGHRPVHYPNTPAGCRGLAPRHPEHGEDRIAALDLDLVTRACSRRLRAGVGPSDTAT